MAGRKFRLSPKKQPLQARSRATYDALLEAAAHILEARGLDGLNTNAVAERAGASIGSLYQYFPNKDALVAALIEREQGQLRDALEVVVADADGKSLIEGVRQLVRAAIELQRRAPRLSAALDYEEGRLPVMALLSRAAEEQSAALVAFLQQHFPRKSAALLRTEAETLRAIARAVIDNFIDRDKPDFRVAEREAVRAVMGYLGADVSDGRHVGP
jgi:AcrR family transcriptional regulator